MNQAELQEQLLKEISKPEFIYTAIAVFAVRIIIWLFFANTMRKTLKLVATENQYLVWPFRYLIYIGILK
jgi:hypothetical protein